MLNIKITNSSEIIFPTFFISEVGSGFASSGYWNEADPTRSGSATLVFSLVGRKIVYFPKCRHKRWT